jgi:hypothetical protein
MRNYPKTTIVYLVVFSVFYLFSESGQFYATSPENTVLFLSFPENASQGTLKLLLELEALGFTPSLSSCGIYIWKTSQNVSILGMEPIDSVLANFQRFGKHHFSPSITLARLQAAEDSMCRKNFHTCVVDGKNNIAIQSLPVAS